MALFGPRDDKDSKSDKTQTDAPAPSSAAAVSPAAAAAREAVPGRSDAAEGLDANAFLGRGSRVTGKLTFDGTARIDGSVEGEIAAHDTLIVGESAVVTAQIRGTTVIIKGKVTGDINAKTRVEIRAPGKLLGNIVTPSLVIHEGVVFEGHCSMGGGAGKGDRKVMPLMKEEGPAAKGEAPGAKASADAGR